MKSLLGVSLIGIAALSAGLFTPSVASAQAAPPSHVPTAAEVDAIAQLRAGIERGDPWTALDRVDEVTHLTRYVPLVQIWADALEAAGQPGPESRALARLVSLTPDDADAWTRLGDRYEGLRFARRALEAWQQAIALEPERLDAHLGVARVQLRRNRPAEALAALKVVHQQNGEHIDALRMIATALEALGRDTEALLVLERAVTLSRDAYLASRTAALCARIGRLDRAEELLRYAIRRADRDADHQALRDLVASRRSDPG